MMIKAVLFELVLSIRVRILVVPIEALFVGEEYIVVELPLVDNNPPAAPDRFQ